GMYLVRVSHRLIALREFANALYRSDISVHGIERFEYDQLRPAACLPQYFFEVPNVIMAPDQLVATGVPHAFDHRVVIELIGDDQAVGDELRDRRDAGQVRHITGGEHERGGFAVQISQLPLELDEGMIGPGDIARSTGPGAD